MLFEHETIYTNKDIVEITNKNNGVFIDADCKYLLIRFIDESYIFRNIVCDSWEVDKII